MALRKRTKLVNAEVCDILKQKEDKLATLNQQSNDAVQLVHSALDGLVAVDQEIATTISEIDEIQVRMSNAKAGLEARRSKNQQIMHNFKSLLCEE